MVGLPIGLRKSGKRVREAIRNRCFKPPPTPPAMTGDRPIFQIFVVDFFAI